MVLCHSWLQIWPVINHPDLHPRALAWGQCLVYGGHFSVDLFLVLSGFCLMLPVVRAGGTLRGGGWGFLKRRAHRILPPYYFGLAFSLLLIATLIGKQTGTHWDGSLPVSRRGIAEHLLLVQWAGSPWQINHAYWSIAVESWIYLLFPLLVLSWRRLGIAATMAGAFLTAYALFFLMHPTRFSMMTPDYLFLFALGMLGAETAFSPAAWAVTMRRVCRSRAALALTLLVYAACAFLGLRRVFNHLALFDALIGAASTLLLVSLAARPESRLRQALSWAPLVFLGTFAYSIYLVHAPLIQVLWQYALFPLGLGNAATFALLTLAGGPLIVGTAYLFFFACERPFLNSRRRESAAPEKPLEVSV